MRPIETLCTVTTFGVSYSITEFNSLFKLSETLKNKVYIYKHGGSGNSFSNTPNILHQSSILVLLIITFKDICKMEDITFQDCKCDFKVVRKLVNFIAPFEDESYDSSDTGDKV